MAIRVIPATAIALTVSFVEPGFTVWADYKVEVDYKEASYTADWREITVEAAVSRPDVLVVDVIDPIDKTVLFTTKVLKDTAKLQEQEVIAKETTKSPQDTYAVSDTPSKELTKFLASSYAGFLDEIRVTQLKNLADTLVAGSAEAKAFVKALKDFQNLTDAVTKTSSKNFTSEVVTLSDATNLTYIIGKQIEDLQAVVESIAYAIEKAPFLEDLHMIDNMDGDIEFGLVKVVGELQLLADQIQSIDTTKALVDAPIVSELLAKSITKAPFEDAATPVDTPALETIKPFTDELVAAHVQTVKNVAKALSDIHGQFVDAIVYQFSKVLSDTAPIDELLAKSITKAPFVDSVAAQDTYRGTLDKLNADSLLASDAAPTYVITKVLADTVVLQETFEQIKFITRQFTDAFDALDSYAANYQPLEGDSTGVTDNEILAFGLGKSETLNMLDNMDGDLTYAIVKSLATELLAVSEKTVIASALQKADNVVAGSAGSLLSQSYVEPGYFAEDYVGTSRTFS
jgi:hypothetical protein